MQPRQSAQASSASTVSSASTAVAMAAMAVAASVVLLWLRRCQRWIKNELYHPFKDLKKTARLRTLARRVDLYCIAWRGDVETSIRMNEAHAVAARAMLGLPPAVAADEIADEIATLSI